MLSLNTAFVGFYERGVGEAYRVGVEKNRVERKWHKPANSLLLKSEFRA
jgi:hypothetical protein